MTNEFSAQLCVILDHPSRYSIQILNSKNRICPFRFLRQETSPNQDAFVYKIFAGDLSLSEVYRLQVLDNSSGKILDQREFASLDLQKNSLKFSLASCANDLYHSERQTMWQVMEQSHPEMIFFVGDTVYADNKTGHFTDHSGGWNNFWHRYTVSFQSLLLYRWPRLVPILALWDDHDFGANKGDSSFRDKAITSFLFELFWGHQGVAGYRKGPGISSVLELNGQRFFMMDNRSFRSPSTDSYQYHWGESVQQFLFEELAKSSDPAWIFSGTQIFGGYLSHDNFEAGQSKNLNDVLRELSKMEAPVLFGTGDVHFSEIMKLEPKLLGYPSFELTSSSIHSYTFPGQHLRGRNPRRVMATSAHNFLMISSRASAKGQIQFAGQCVARNGRARFEFKAELQRSS